MDGTEFSKYAILILELNRELVAGAEQCALGSNRSWRVIGSPCERDSGIVLRRRLAIVAWKMLFQLHRIMKNAADFHNILSGHAIEQEVARIANSIATATGLLAGMKEMIGSAMLSDLRPLNAPDKFGICRNFLDRRLDELLVALQRLRAHVLVRPGKDT